MSFDIRVEPKVGVVTYKVLVPPDGLNVLCCVVLCGRFVPCAARPAPIPRPTVSIKPRGVIVLTGLPCVVLACALWCVFCWAVCLGTPVKHRLGAIACELTVPSVGVGVVSFRGL